MAQGILRDMVWSTVVPLGSIRGSLYLLLNGTQGEDSLGVTQHALHLDQVQGGQRDEAPLGQEGEQDSQDSHHRNFWS